MSQVKLKVVQFPEQRQGRQIAKRQRKAHAASPIKDARTIKAMRAALADSGKYSKRNLAIFDLGICSGRRCGDILCFQMFDVWDDLHGLKRMIEYHDQKTGTKKKFFLTESAHRNLMQYLIEAGFISEDGKRLVDTTAFLFPSRKKSAKRRIGSYTYEVKHGNEKIKVQHRLFLPDGCLEVGTYRDILNKAAREHGITDIEHLGTHTMRKTFGYHAFRQNGAEFVQLALGHSSMRVTEHYLTLDDEYLEENFSKLQIPGMDDEI